LKFKQLSVCSETYAIQKLLNRINECPNRVIMVMVVWVYTQVTLKL